MPYATEALLRELPGVGLKHVMHFVSGADMPAVAVGSGCMIASRFPILDTAWHAFSSGGRPYRIDQWDWHTGKGVGLARVLLPAEYGMVDVYVSHLQAQYHDPPADAYASQRTLQAFEAANFIRTTRRSDLTLLLADLNAGPDSLPYDTLTTLAGFKDAYSCTHTKEEELLHGGTLSAGRVTIAPLPLAAAGHSIYDSTFGGQHNVFSPMFGVSPPPSPPSPPTTTSAAPPAGGASSGGAAPGSGSSSSSSSSGWKGPACDINARLDYVLFGTGSASWPFSVQPFSVNLMHRTWHVVGSDIRLTDYIKLRSGRTINMSDHSAVYAELACVIVMPPATAAAVVRAAAATPLPPPPAAAAAAAMDVTASPAASSATGSEGSSGVRSRSVAAPRGRPSWTSVEGAPLRPPDRPLRRGVSHDSALTRAQVAAGKLLQDAIVAAGVPLDRCALPTTELQLAADDSSTSSADDDGSLPPALPPAPEPVPAATPAAAAAAAAAASRGGGARWYTAYTAAPLQALATLARPLLPWQVLRRAGTTDLARQVQHAAPPAVAWKSLLTRCQASLEAGLWDARALRHAQIVWAAYAMAGGSVLGGLAGALRTTHGAAPMGAMAVAALFYSGFGLGFYMVLSSHHLRVAVATIVALVVVGVSALYALYTAGGGAALLTALAAALLPLGALLYWVALVGTAHEARAYERAIIQLRFLQRRPPAVVA